MKDSLLLFRANQSKLEQQQKISTARGAAPAPPQALTRRTLSPLAAQQPSTPNPHSTWRRRLPGRQAPLQPPSPPPVIEHAHSGGWALGVCSQLAPSLLGRLQPPAAAAARCGATRRYDTSRATAAAVVKHPAVAAGGCRCPPRPSNPRAARTSLSTSHTTVLPSTVWVPRSQLLPKNAVAHNPDLREGVSCLRAFTVFSPPRRRCFWRRAASCTCGSMDDSVCAVSTNQRSERSAKDLCTTTRPSHASATRAHDRRRTADTAHTL